MNVVIIIAIISVLWVVVWKFTMLDTMPVDKSSVKLIKQIIAVLLGGPMIWIIALIYGLRILSRRYWGQEE